MDVAFSVFISLPFIVGIGGVLGLHLVVRFRRPSHLKPLRCKAVPPSLQALGATEAGPRQMTLLHRGVEWTIRLIPGEAADSLAIQRSLPLDEAGLPESPGIRIIPEGPLHRLYKRLVHDSELQVGTDDVDRAVFFDRVTDAEATRQWLGQPGVQHALLHVFATGGSRVGTGMSLTPGSPPLPFAATFGVNASWTTPEGIATTLDALHILSESLPPAAAPARPESWTAGCLLHLALAAWAGCSLLLASITASIWSTVETGLGMASIGLFVPLYGLTGLVALWQSRRRRTLRPNGVLCILFYGWFAQALTAAAMVYIFNGWGDPSAQLYSVTVEERYTTQGDSGHTLYRVRLSALPELSEESIRQGLSETTYERVEVGDSCALRVGRGRLGVSWKAFEGCSLDPEAGD